MKTFWSFLVICGMANAAGPAKTPVLVELFTSEGCSSCPPADQLLAELARSQTVEAAAVVVLSEHVDYWDHIGWKDPFSSRELTERQRSYAGLVQSGSGLYTPQMVVDGRFEFVGSDADRAKTAIRDAARKPKLGLRLSFSDGRAVVDLSSNSTGARVAIYVAVARTEAVSRVARGENRGRELRHTSVVTKLVEAGTAKTNEAWSGKVELRGYDPAHDHLVSFAQRVDTREVVAVQILR